MEIYHISLDPGSYPIIKGENNKLSIRSIVFDEHSSNLNVDNKFMLENYNFAITSAELECFNMHRRAWLEFSKAGSNWCLILENSTRILESVSVIEIEIEELPDDWDIYFPFNKSDLVKQPSLRHYPYF